MRNIISAKKKRNRQNHRAAFFTHNFFFLADLPWLYSFNRYMRRLAVESTHHVESVWLRRFDVYFCTYSVFVGSLSMQNTFGIAQSIFELLRMPKMRRQKFDS